MSKIPYITRLKVKNYRSLADIEITLHPLTVFVGQNSAGKSNVIDVLRFVRDALTDGFDKALLYRGGMRGIRYWFAEEREDITIQLDFEGAEWLGQYGFAFGVRDRGQVEIKWEKLSVSEGAKYEAAPVFEVVDGQLVHLPELIERVRQNNPQASYPSLNVSKKALYLAEVASISPLAQKVRHFLSNMNFYDMASDGLRQPQVESYPFPLLENGQNLATTLRELKQKELSDAIIAPLRYVAKGVDDYSIQNVGGFLVTNLHYIFENGSQQQVMANLGHESDGTLRLLSILAALYQERFPSPLAIEEPEKAIYPGVLELLYYLFDEAACTYQVLISTQSADLLTSFPADSLRVVEKEHSKTKIGPISTHQYKSISENIFSAGALMRAVGLTIQEDGYEAKCLAENTTPFLTKNSSPA